ncbi:MAG: thioredoxin family protein [Hyphomicrobiales bacterium]
MAVETPICDFGWKASEFTLPATDGKTYGLNELRGPNGTLVMFICNHCPFVKSVLERIIRDAVDLQSHGVASVAICSNDAAHYPDDSFDNMKRVAEERGFPFPYLHDESQAVARAYDAVCTPDFFGFDKDLGLQYRGRLDESRMTPVPNAARELYDAMVTVAATGRGPEHQIASMGCSIKWTAA